jgi:hypothetical protein
VRWRQLSPEFRQKWRLVRCGAVIFVTSAIEYPVKRRVLLSLLSFLCGLFYKPTASILIGVASMIPTITQDSFERGIVYSLARSLRRLSLCGLGYGCITVLIIREI